MTYFIKINKDIIWETTEDLKRVRLHKGFKHFIQRDKKLHEGKWNNVDVVKFWFTYTDNVITQDILTKEELFLELL